MSSTCPASPKDPGHEYGGAAADTGGDEAGDGNIKGALDRYIGLRARVKCTVMLLDIKEWPAMNVVYRSYFPEDRMPARSAFATNGLVFGARVEVECLATMK